MEASDTIKDEAQQAGAAVGFNEAEAWKPRIQLSAIQLLHLLYLSFNEAEAWKPRIPPRCCPSEQP